MSISHLGHVGIRVEGQRAQSSCDGTESGAPALEEGLEWVCGTAQMSSTGYWPPKEAHVLTFRPMTVFPTW